MTTYTMTGPDGKDYSIDGPAGASEDEVRSQMQAAHSNLQPQSGGADTMADSAKRGLPPLMMPNMFGIDKPAPVKAPPLSQQWDNLKDAIGGVPTGIAGGIAGIPGDIESLIRTGLSKVSPVSPEGVLPTTANVQDALAGPATPSSAAGRAVGNMISPLLMLKGASLPGKAVDLGGNIAAHSLGATTGAGTAAVKGAFNAGREGGSTAQAFLDHMRGNAPAGEVVQTAKDAVSQLRQDRSTAYKSGMASNVIGDPTILNFAPVDKAINDVANVGTFKGQTLSESAQAVRDRIVKEVESWKALDPAEFHTPEGLDALKQKIGNLQYEGGLESAAKPGSPGAVIINNVRNAIKDQIVQQAPGYAKVMKDYSEASDELRNIEQTLSLKPNANVGTSLRKLQSIMRNNANANYGQRVELGNTLDAKAGGTLLPQLAGQSLNSYTARGIQGPLSAAGGLTALATNPALLLPLALTSPRLVGEGAFAAGKLLGRTAKKASVVGGNAGVGGINPKLLSTLTPQILSQLLLLQPQSATAP